MEPVSTGLAVAWLIGKIVLWGGSVAGGVYLGKKVIDKFGDTPGNNLSNAGISPDQQYQEWLSWQKDRKKYFEDKNDEWFSDLRDRNKKLEEESKALAEQLKTEQDPKEKARISALINQNKKEIADNNREMSKKIDELNKGFENFGRGQLTFSQFQSKSNEPSLSSWKNWGIIAFCVIIAIILINFVKKMLGKLSGGSS